MNTEEIIKFIKDRENNPIFLQSIVDCINKYKKFNLNTYEHKLKEK